jgi:hypothetical protein
MLKNGRITARLTRAAHPAMPADRVTRAHLNRV